MKAKKKTEIVNGKEQEGLSYFIYKLGKVEREFKRKQKLDLNSQQESGSNKEK